MLTATKIHRFSGSLHFAPVLIAGSRVGLGLVHERLIAGKFHVNFIAECLLSTALTCIMRYS
jgi:hypothetical protein